MLRNLNQTYAGGTRRVLDITRTGRLGSAVPASGQNGAGYLFNDVTTNSLQSSEVRGRIESTTLPSGSWFAWNDSRLQVNVISDGIYFYSYRLYVFGVPENTLAQSAVVVGTPVPVITVQPSNQTAVAPSAATFTVTATGTAISYQWSSGPSNTGPWTPIVGATASVYNTGATILGNTGTFYRVAITNLAGTTNSNGNASLTVTASGDTTPPVHVGTVVASAITSNGATLTWPAATDLSGIQGYEYSINGGSYVGAGASLTANITGLAASTNYTVAVRAIDNANNRSTPALTASFSTLATNDIIVPTLTGIVSVNNIASNSAVISWPSGADNILVVGYDYSVNGGSWVPLGNVNSIGLSGLSVNTNYTVAVRARDAAGNVSTPAITGAFTTANTDTVPPVLTGFLTITAVQTSGYTVSWPAGTDNVGISNYQYRINSGTWTSIGTLTTTGVTGRPPGYSDIFEVRALDVAGNISNILSATAAAPSDTTAPLFTGVVNASNVTATGYTLSWPVATDEIAVTGYEYRINTGAWSQGGNVTTAIVTNRAYGSSDFVEVRAFDAAGNRSTILSTTVQLQNLTTTIAGPSAGTVNTPTSNFTVGVNGSFTGTVTIVPSDAGNGGIFTPSSIQLTPSNIFGTFTYTATSVGSKSLTLANDLGFINPTLPVTVVIGASSSLPTEPSTNLSTLLDLRVFTADSNVRRSTASFTLNYPSYSDINVNTFAMEPATAKTHIATQTRTSITVLKTSSPLTVTVNFRDGQNVTRRVEKLMILDDDVSSIVMANGDLVTVANVSLIQG